MTLDINTLFLITMYVEVMLGLILFLGWAQNFGKRALAWWGCAHMLRAVSIMLLGLHGSIPDWASIEVGNSTLFVSFALTWSGARVFDRRSSEAIWCMFGVVIWLLAGRLAPFQVTPEARLLLGSGIVTTYTWLAAYEFWRGRDEPLVSRWPVIFMLFAHGALFLLRTPLAAVLHHSVANEFGKSAWLDLLSIEALLFTISIAFLLLAIAKERAENGHRAAAQTDPLTGVANRRGFMEQSETGKRRTVDLRPTAVVLFDLDHFKSINDRFGHAVGDRALQVFAEVARQEVGSHGLVGRWGGDEFAAVLYDTTREQAEQAAERIRAGFELAAADLDGWPANATVSVGVVFQPNGNLDLSALMVDADETLYRAKERGRNRVMAADASCWEPDPDDTVVTSLEAHRRRAVGAA